MGWGDLNNGALLDAMTGQFEALVTVDKRLPQQQHMTDRPFGVVVLRARSNRLADLLPLVPALLAALAGLGPGEVSMKSLANRAMERARGQADCPRCPSVAAGRSSPNR